MDEEEREQEESRRRHFDDLKNLQDDAQATTPIDVHSLPESVPLAHRRHMADSEKEKGNEAFYAKDYEEAEAYYSRSIHFAADDPSTWANRALIRLKLQQPEEALEDCTHALALNPQYMKALHRKGKALYELQRYEEAVRYFQRALAESPGNTQINGDLMVARRRLRTEGPSELGQHTSSRGGSETPSCTIEELPDEDEKAPTKPPPAGYTRVVIEEDSDSESADDQATAPPRTVNASGGGNFHKVVIEEVEESEDETPKSLAPAPSSAGNSSPPGISQKHAAEDVSAPLQNMGTTKTSAAPLPQSTDTHAFRRVVIEEDNGSEDDMQPAAPVAATHSNVNQLTGGPAVHSQQRAMGATPVEAASGSGNSNGSGSRRNFRRIVIEDEESSEGENHTPVPPATTASAVVAPPSEQGAAELTPLPPPAGVVAAGLCFDDMD